MEGVGPNQIQELQAQHALAEREVEKWLKMEHAIRMRKFYYDRSMAMLRLRRMELEAKSIRSTVARARKELGHKFRRLKLVPDVLSSLPPKLQKLLKQAAETSPELPHYLVGTEKPLQEGSTRTHNSKSSGEKANPA